MVISTCGSNTRSTVFYLVAVTMVPILLQTREPVSCHASDLDLTKPEKPV
jgi:hypothetical protein